MKNAYNKRGVLHLPEFKDFKVTKPEEYNDIIVSVLESLEAGVSHKVICKNFNIKSTIIAFVKEKHGLFTKGVFRGLSSEQIAGYKRHMAECDACENDYTPVAEWLKQPKHVDDITDPGEPGYIYSTNKAIETPTEPPIMDLLDPRLQVKTKPEIPAATPDYSDVYDAIQNNYKLYTALRTMLDDMSDGCIGKLTISFCGGKVKGYGIETE